MSAVDAAAWSDEPDEDAWVTVESDLSADVDPAGLGLLVPSDSSASDAAPMGVLAGLTGARDQLLRVAARVAGAVGCAADGQLVEALRVVQQVSNLTVPVDAALLAEVERRGLHETHGYPRVAAMVVGELHERPARAKQRAHAARQFVARTDLLGQVVPPRRPVVADALGTGSIGLDQALAVDRALAALPASVGPGEVAEVESTLVGLATGAEPGLVDRAGRHVKALYAPDGPRPGEELDRMRQLVLRQRADGMGEIRGVLTPECLAAVQAVLHALAKPVTTTFTEPVAATVESAAVAGPDAGDCGAVGDAAAAAAHSEGRLLAERTECPSMDGTAYADPRTAGQRLHDALLDAAMRLLRSGSLPDCGGTPVTIAVTMTVDQLREGCGLAGTEYGTTIPVPWLLELAAECEYLPVVLSETGGVVHYRSIARTAPPSMAKALRTRDGGCTFPGCTRPAAWTERHHVHEHRHGGPTALDNLTLVCRYHHRAFARHGWTVTMRHGRPWWLAPPELDPSRTPRRNTHWDALGP